MISPDELTASMALEYADREASLPVEYVLAEEVATYGDTTLHFKFSDPYSTDSYGFNMPTNRKLETLRRWILSLESEWLDDMGNVVHYKGQPYRVYNMKRDVSVECVSCFSNKYVRVTNNRDIAVMYLLPQISCNCIDRKI